ncbi:hypothetical protein MUP79_04210 [Candidatus Bathyarchaeota archaeon]|nr:hypothetical protein [Candidatus Bathyarchaeota archaeon]
MSAYKTGNFAFAEKYYELILDLVNWYQDQQDLRIHKGAYLYQLGLSLMFQGRLDDALRAILLAYIEDVLSTPAGRENDAEGAPAASVLRTGFRVVASNLQIIKDIAAERKREGEIVKRPETILEYLQDKAEADRDLLSLCDPRPTTETLRSQIMRVSPEAQAALARAVERTGEELLEVATAIAKSNGRDQITEDDVRAAISRLEGQKVGG